MFGGIFTPSFCLLFVVVCGMLKLEALLCLQHPLHLVGDPSETNRDDLAKGAGTLLARVSGVAGPRVRMPCARGQRSRSRKSERKIRSSDRS